LRGDFSWTDGSRVTAYDFEWAWKRNLSLGEECPYGFLLDDVEGARDFRCGRSANSEGVGVKATDQDTLEVRLHTPTAFFLYIVTLPITYPINKEVVDEYNDNWWHPEYIISNGPFMFTGLDNEQICLERFPDYGGSRRGNIKELIGIFIDDTNPNIFLDGAIHAFQEDHMDMFVLLSDEPPKGLSNYYLVPDQDLSVEYLLFNPTLPPFDSVLVRKAFALSVDASSLGIERTSSPASGGLIHPRIPGYSSRSSIGHDETQARKLIQEAGYQRGHGLPRITLSYFGHFKILAHKLRTVWSEVLGVEVKCQEQYGDPEITGDCHMALSGWMPDYPDPDSFLRHSTILKYLERNGYDNRRLNELMENVVSCADRKERLEIFRKIDSLLVNGETLCVPLYYGGIDYWLIRDRIKNFDPITWNFEDVFVKD
jgi:oligopeptide transport system substrate-binding protein